MPRRIEVDPDRPTHPKWLGQAELVARIADEVEAAGLPRYEWERRVKEATDLDGLVARRLERAFRFLLQEYPQAFEVSKFLASWASVLELSKLKARDATRADEIAGMVFDGRMTAPRIAELARTISHGQQGVFAEARALAREGPSFEQRTLQLIREDPLLLGMGYIDEVTVPVRGDALMPDLILKQGGKTIAVEIKMATESPSLYTIGGHLARLAQLEQRYSLAVLVLPRTAQRAASMARDLQLTWSGHTPHIVML